MWTVIKHNSNAIVTITTRCKVTALDFYDKEARTLMQDESLEVWDNGKLVSRCQFDILPALKDGEPLPGVTICGNQWKPRPKMERPS